MILSIFIKKAKKQFFENSYNNYLENLGQENNTKNIINSILILNGDVKKETYIDDEVLVPRPHIKAIHLEFFE